MDISFSFDNETKDLSNYELLQVDHGPGSDFSRNDTKISLSITTESLAAWPYLNNTFTWTTQFKDLEFSTHPLTITEPKDGVTVYDNSVRATGTVKNLPKQHCELSLWACLESYDEIWYPQETLTMTGEETWEAYTKPGFSTHPADIGKEFGIVVLVAAKEADEELWKARRGEGNAADGWGWKPLPKGAKILDQITVIRGKR